MSEHIFGIGHLGTYCTQCGCQESDKETLCPGIPTLDIPNVVTSRLDAAEARIESLERELAELREKVK